MVRKLVIILLKIQLHYETLRREREIKREKREGNSRQKASLTIYDIIGNEVAVLVNEEKPAGEYQVEWDTLAYSSGAYFYRLQAGEFTATKKTFIDEVKFWVNRLSERIKDNKD